MKKIPYGDIVEIKWRDSTMYITQCSKDDDFSVTEITSVGQFIKQDEKSVVIAGDILSDGELRRVIIIPKENIVEFN